MAGRSMQASLVLMVMAGLLLGCSTGGPGAGSHEDSSTHQAPAAEPDSAAHDEIAPDDDANAAGNDFCERFDETVLTPVLGDEIIDRDFSPDPHGFNHSCRWLGSRDVRVTVWTEPDFRWLTVDSPLDEYEPIEIDGFAAEAHRGFFDGLLIEGPGGTGIQVVILGEPGWDDQQQLTIAQATVAALG